MAELACIVGGILFVVSAFLSLLETIPKINIKGISTLTLMIIGIGLMSMGISIKVVLFSS